MDSGTKIPWVQILISYVTLGKTLNLPVPQFPHLYNWNNNGPYLLGLM